MPLNDTAKNIMLTAFGNAVDFVSLHTAEPDGSGSNEVSGGDPAYVRKAVTWNAASSANLDSSNTPVFDVPGGDTSVTHAGYWSAETNGTFYGFRPLPAPETFGNQGTLSITDIDESLVEPT